MNYKKIGCSLIGGLLLSSTPAMALPAVNGSWRITYYADPNRNAPAQTYCVAFTTTANSIANEPLSGTWQEAPGAAPTWRGSWVQQGDRVKWWGSVTNIQYVTSHQGTLITSSPTGTATPTGLMTGQYQFYSIQGGVGAAQPEVGTWSAQQVANCP